MAKRSKTVDTAIKRCWAKLASKAAAKALYKIEWDKPAEAETYMGWVETWLENAGADATKWNFHV